jgi:hypothetical protein
MDALAKTVVICALCRCPLDTREDHAVVRSDYAHLKCADEYDAREWGREFKREAEQ